MHGRVLLVSLRQSILKLRRRGQLFETREERGVQNLDTARLSMKIMEFNKYEWTEIECHHWNSSAGADHLRPEFGRSTPPTARTATLLPYSCLEMGRK